jgi:hypothetical protein
MSEIEYGAMKTFANAVTGEGRVRPAEPARAENGTVVSPLRSQEAFDAYCVQIQTRLAEYAAHRIHFLQSAHERLTRLLYTARAVEDTALYNELWQHRVVVRELLEALNQLPKAAAPAPVATPPTAPSWPTVAPPAKPMPITPTNGHFSRDEPRPAPHVPPPSAPPPSPMTVSRQAQPPAEPQPAPEAPRLPRHPVRPLLEIEADAIRLRDEVKDWNQRKPISRENGDLNVPNALRLRAVACRQRRLEEEAGDTEVGEVTDLAKDILGLMDKANDKEYTVAFDYELDPRPTAYQWNELAERYEETARAQEAFEWWLAHRNIITVVDVQPLAESVAAIQQRFNRLLFRIGARDPFQQQLFDDLRAWAREAQCYLFSLRPKVPIAELVEKASALESAWEQARAPIAVANRRQQAIEDVIAMVSHRDFGEDFQQDEKRVQDALAYCRELNVPASDRRLRDALLPWAAFLESDERAKETLREINLEWERRTEAGKVEVLEDEPDGSLDAMDRELQAVREVTRGKRCLMLGGTCREENRRKIEEALQLQELVWPSTKPSDPLAKFDTEIRHADIVALLTRFSRKEWKNSADICAREGKKFVHLTTGYGVSQVVHHFYIQIAPQAVENRQ